MQKCVLKFCNFANSMLGLVLLLLLLLLLLVLLLLLFHLFIGCFMIILFQKKKTANRRRTKKQRISRKPKNGLLCLRGSFEIECISVRISQSSVHEVQTVNLRNILFFKFSFFVSLVYCTRVFEIGLFSVVEI